MREVLASEEGKARYALRKSTSNQFSDRSRKPVAFADSAYEACSK